MKIKNRIAPQFRAEKKAKGLDLFFYDVIGQGWFGDGITASLVKSAIDNAGPISQITAHLNSGGGDSFEGITIHNLMRQQGVPVNVIIEGLAASAAFTIAMAGDSIQVCEAGMMMMHNALCACYGYASDLRQTAELLDKHSGTLRDMYAKRSGMSADEAQKLMDAETWMTADEAMEKGFATGKMETTPEKAKEAKALAAQFDLSRFSKVPESLKNVEAESDEPHVDTTVVDHLRREMEYAAL